MIYYGKGGEIFTNNREEVEMAALCLRILQASIVYLDTLMLQDVLAEPRWSELLAPADRRGLTRSSGAISAPTAKSASTSPRAWSSATVPADAPRASCLWPLRNPLAQVGVPLAALPGEYRVDPDRRQLRTTRRRPARTNHRRGRLLRADGWR
ncbi:Tn3 family transposase [Streptomyces sp. NPDC017868]|uniref:Tn3 family transposase n=1 Tax=Streptomyces sp. NPDC017868 TaxID=3365014 RepID=UPI00379F03B3